MVELHFRVHYKNSDGGQVTHWTLDVPQWIIDNVDIDRCIIGKEVDASRPHFQMYINYNKSLSYFRQTFKKRFNEAEGNKDYSLSEVKNRESILSYVMKENVYKTKGFSQSELDAIPKWKNAQEYKKDALQYSKSKNTNEQIVEKLRQVYNSKVWVYDADCINIIVSYIEKYYGRGFKQINSMKIRDNALGILNTLNTGTLHIKLMNEAFPDLYGGLYVEAD